MQTPILIAIAAIFLSGFRIAQEYQRAIVFRLGHFKTVKGPGLYWLIPLIETRTTRNHYQRQRHHQGQRRIVVHDHSSRKFDCESGQLQFGSLSVCGFSLTKHYWPTHTRRSPKRARKNQCNPSENSRSNNRTMGCQNSNGRNERC